MGATKFICSREVAFFLSSFFLELFCKPCCQYSAVKATRDVRSPSLILQIAKCLSSVQQRVSVSLVAAELILSLLWTASHSCSLIYRFAASIINFAVLSKHLQPQLSDRSSASDRSRWPARLETFPFLGFGCCCKSTPNGHGAWCSTRDWPPIPLMLLHCLRADTDYLRLLSPRVVLILVVKLGSDPSATTEPRRRQASLFASPPPPPSGRMDVVN